MKFEEIIEPIMFVLMIFIIFIVCDFLAAHFNNTVPLTVQLWTEVKTDLMSINQTR